jgi:hypothetical protein
VLYTGDGATTLAVTGVGFQPDFTWIKNTGEADSSVLVDEVRGANNYLSSDLTNAEVDDSTFVASLDSDGFTVGNDVAVNTNTEVYASWNWLGDGVAGGTLNEDGSEDSQVNVNTTAGFSIVTYTGTGANATIGHGLSSAPELVITKKLSDAGTDNSKRWAVGTDKGVDFTDYQILNTNALPVDNADFWNDTAPTASVFTIGTDSTTNSSGDDYVAYCFHSIEGYSKVGSYTGNNNADGTFVYTGFRPAFLIEHVLTTGVESWTMYDDKRDSYNVVNNRLFADSALDYSGTAMLDFVSNGIKWRDGAGYGGNQARDYWYVAFAQSPFKYSNAR